METTLCNLRVFYPVKVVMTPPERVKFFELFNSLSKCFLKVWTGKLHSALNE